ncbi:hypothetical protein DL897_15360 [Thermoflavimicrobium daqui]|uniref:Uncharacterized protein n=1 Tax=Thermoflavimicrobium daqui TaxID=2137476 RepID=A0A364K1Q8_9BACL|nr:hypothetical protein DL897_15360 [Thermoflavimicrobium daqui]
MYDLIQVSKVIYLEKLNRFGDAQKFLEDLAVNKNNFIQDKEIYTFQSKSNESTLNMYEMYSKLLARNGSLSEAKVYALKGIEIARLDKMYERSLELWTTLGSIYIKQNKLNLAECCFRTALKLKDKVKREYLLAYVYIQLGMLHDNLGDLKRSEKSFLNARKYSKKTNDVYLETQALSGLGDCYIKLKKDDKVHQCFSEALELAEKHLFIDQKNKILLKLAIYLKDIGDPTFTNYALDFFHSYAKGGEKEMNNTHEQIKNHTVGDPPGS